MPTPHPDALWRLATAQWAEITANSPDLAPAVFLQQRLLRLTLDASAGLDETPPATLSAVSIREKWTRGLPALRNEAIAIPAGLKDILLPLCTALAECGAGESALHIRDAIAANGIDADSLLGVSLARNQKAIRTSALHMGFSPDLVWLIGELGSAPLAHHLSSVLEGHRERFSTRTCENASRPLFRLGPWLLPVLRVLADVHRGARRRARAALLVLRARVVPAIAPLRLLRQRW